MDLSSSEVHSPALMRGAVFLWLLAAFLVTVATGEGTYRRLPNRVAAGDVSPFGAVLWARSTVVGEHTFWYLPISIHGSFWKSRSTVVLDVTVPAKVELRNLVPGATYIYAAVDPAGDFDAGVFRTPHLPGVHRGLRFGVSGDSRGELGPYPSIVNAVSKSLDFFVNLGDTIYADVASPALPAAQAETLEEFRIKHEEVLSERLGLNAFGDLRAATAFYTVIDDHEVTNDFAGGAPPASDPRFGTENVDFINETHLYEAGLQAFHDYQPIQERFYRLTGDPRTEGKRDLFRARFFGSDAAVFLLDARSFRDEPLTPVSDPLDAEAVREFLERSFDPSRTMLGKIQLARLKAGLRRAQKLGVTWKFVIVPEPIQNLSVVLASDRFEGYAAERTELLSFIRDGGIENVVFVAADFHGALVNNLTYQSSPFGDLIEVDAFEIITGPSAYDPTLGPVIIDGLFGAGLLPTELKELYDALPGFLKDVFLRLVVDSALDLFGLDRLGLEGSSIEAHLLQGSYVAAHVYGWTEFVIAATTQILTVTTYGTEPYTEEELLADPEDVLTRRTRIVSRFIVVPK